MKKAAFIIAEQNFRDEEYQFPKEVLQESGIEVGQGFPGSGPRLDYRIAAPFHHFPNQAGHVDLGRAELVPFQPAENTGGGKSRPGVGLFQKGIQL